jgi:acetyl esterase/lipase
MGTAGPAAGFDGGQYRDESSRLQAVVDLFGPADLTRTNDSDAFARAIIQLVLGSSMRVRRAASPLTYVGPHDPPFLVVHGTQDTMIPPRQSREFAQRLRAAGAQATLVLVEHTGHGLITPGEQPSATALVRMVTGFFVRTLAPGSAPA